MCQVRELRSSKKIATCSLLTMDSNSIPLDLNIYPELTEEDSKVHKEC